MADSKPFRVEVIADSSGTWAGNKLRYETAAEAEAWARGVYARWTLVREWRVIDDDAVVHASGPNTSGIWIEAGPITTF